MTFHDWPETDDPAVLRAKISELEARDLEDDEGRFLALLRKHLAMVERAIAKAGR